MYPLFATIKATERQQHTFREISGLILSTFQLFKSFVFETSFLFQ